jgi:hypothetical protein
MKTLVGQHGIARDTIISSLSLFLFMSYSLFPCLCLSLSPLFPDKKLPALDPSLATLHLYTMKLDYNELDYNQLDYNQLDYNKLDYNELGYNELPVITNILLSLFWSQIYV